MNLGFELNPCQKSWALRFPWPHCQLPFSPCSLNTSVPSGCSAAQSCYKVGSYSSTAPPICSGTDSQKSSNCVCRELEFSHLCSPALKYFPTSICPIQPISKAMGTTNYSLNVCENMWTVFRQDVAQLGAL